MSTQLYRLSDKESTHVIVNMGQPLAWVALSSTSEAEVSEALVARAYATVSCRNPLLRGVYRPEVSQFSLVIPDVSEVIQNEAEGKLPAHLSRAFHTRDEAWAEYVRRIGRVRWVCDAMWEVTLCALDRATSSDPAYVILAHVSHGVSDGAAVMHVLGEFVQVLNAGLALPAGELPPHDFLGPSLPVPKPFLERYPKFRFLDAASDAEKAELFAKAIPATKAKEGKMSGIVVDKIICEEASKTFVAKCKAAGVTVTAGLYAAVAMSSAKHPRRFDAAMPLSYRTKDCFGEVAVSFSDAMFSVELTPIWAETAAAEAAGDEDAVWTALAVAFNKAIRAKLAAENDKYTGCATNYVLESLGDPPTQLKETLLSGPDEDVFSMCLSNVGFVDKYFAACEEKGPIRATEVTAYCSNQFGVGVVLWCYTFKGKLHLGIFDMTPPDRKDVFETFANKVIKFVEKM